MRLAAAQVAAVGDPALDAAGLGNADSLQQTLVWLELAHGNTWISYQTDEKTGLRSGKSETGGRVGQDSRMNRGVKNRAAEPGDGYEHGPHEPITTSRSSTPTTSSPQSGATSAGQSAGGG